ncbi:MAG: zf-TFIIB domain-containing protein [Campylobacterota bacterium]|nr:zf-TFIIB domain-containing protein [Campylobacterota bacterium]
MKCHFCSAPLPKKGLTCEYCGKRNPLNLTTLPKVDIEEKKSSYQCPTCNITCDNINIGLKTRMIIQRCNGCDGLFLSADILEALIQAHKNIKKEIDLHVLRFVKNNPRFQKETVIRYKKCPVCNTVMHRLNYRSVSGVIVDRCYQHGIWLDAGELLQLYEWKQAGGLVEKKLEEKSKTFKNTPSFKSPDKSNSSNSYFDPIGNFFEWLQG